MEDQSQNSEPAQNQITENIQPGGHKPDRKLIIFASVVVVFALAVIGGSVLYNFVQRSIVGPGLPPGPNGCTGEAKQCPDGSSVGRTGPNCEFAPCPSAAPDVTAGWQTYRNEEYGFEVKYPPETGIKKDDLLKSQNSIATFFIEETAGEKNGFKQDFYLFRKMSSDTLRDWFGKEFQGIKLAEQPVEKQINGYNGLEVKFNQSVQYSSLFIEKDNIVAEFPLYLTSENRQLIGTFKFIDKTANWQTYRNEEYGFEFKYPNDWIFSDPSGYDKFLNYPSVRDFTVSIQFQPQKFNTTKTFNDWPPLCGPAGPDCISLQKTQTSLGINHAIKDQGSTYYILNNAGLIGVSITPLLKSADPSLALTVNQILSTFKFIK